MTKKVFFYFNLISASLILLISTDLFNIYIFITVSNLACKKSIPP